MKAFIVESMTNLSQDIIRVVGRVEPPFVYSAGQYITFETSQGPLPLSIANRCNEQGRLDFHIRKMPENSVNTSLFQMLDEKAPLKVSEPQGHCHVENLDKSMRPVFIAAGTGFAPVKAMLEACMHTSLAIDFYWLAKESDDFYLKNVVYAWAHDTPTFHYHFKLWSRNDSFVEMIDSLDKQGSDALKGMQFILAGPFDMVRRFADELVSRGVSTSQLLSDALPYNAKEES